VNAAEINIDCLRAAERLLRDHDAKITAAADELKLLKRDRVALSERVQACIDVLCGRGTPDLFAHPPAAEPGVPVSEPVVVAGLPTPPDVTPPLAPGETVEMDVVRAAKLADIAALQTPDLEPIVDWLLADTETETVGDLWDWINEDYDGMRHAGITAMMRKRRPKEYLPHAQAFADAVMMFIVNNGHGPAEGMAEALEVPAPGPLADADRRAVLADVLAELDGPTAGVHAPSPPVVTPPRKPPPRPPREPTAFPDKATDEKRAELLRLLALNPDGLRVKEIAEATGWEGHVVRYHLKSDLFEAADPTYRLSPWILSEAGESAAEKLSRATAPAT